MIYLGEDGIKELEFGLAQPDMAYPFLFFVFKFYYFSLQKERAKRKNKIRNLIKFKLSWGNSKIFIL